MFLCPDDSVLWKLTELHVMVTQKRMPEDKETSKTPSQYEYKGLNPKIA